MSLQKNFILLVFLANFNSSFAQNSLDSTNMFGGFTLLPPSYKSPPQGCPQIKKARQECAAAGNYGQCLYVKLDWLFRQLKERRGLVPSTSSQVVETIEGYYEDCPK